METKSTKTRDSVPYVLTAGAFNSFFLAVIFGLITISWITNFAGGWDYLFVPLGLWVTYDSGRDARNLWRLRRTIL